MAAAERTPSNRTELNRILPKCERIDQKNWLDLGGMAAHPPERRLTAYTQYQRVADWLVSIDRPDGIRFLDMDRSVQLIFIQTLDDKTRSSLERTCKSLLALSRSSLPHLEQLTIHYTTTWNHDYIVEITAKFSAEHQFHAVFMSKKSSPNWITGGWSTERKSGITTGSWTPEKLRLSATFAERTSRYVEYWLRCFKMDVLHVKVENLIPGKELEIQQMNHVGEVPPLELKRFILEGANNIRFINLWMTSLNAPKEGNILEATRVEPIHVDLINVGKLDQIFHNRLLSSGKVNLSFQKANTIFNYKTLISINCPCITIQARKVPAEAVRLFLKRWSRGQMNIDFKCMYIVETTTWEAQKLEIGDVLDGIMHRAVELKTKIPLHVLTSRPFHKPGRKSPQIFQVFGPRTAFCVKFYNRFIFEVVQPSQVSKIKITETPRESGDDEFEKAKLYMEMLRRRICSIFN